MKLRGVLLIAAVAVMSLVSLEGYALQIGDQTVDITVSDVFATRYIWRGQDLNGDNDPVQQPSVDISLPGFFFGADMGLNVWGSFAVDSGHETSDEMDYTFSLSKDLDDGAYTLGLGYTYFDFPNAGRRTANVHEPWVSASLNKIPDLPIDVSFDLFAGYDIKAHSDGPDNGFYYSWGFGTEVDLPDLAIFQEGQTLGIGITNWGNDGVANLESSGLYATDISLGTSYAVGVVSVSPSINYTAIHEAEINNDDDEFWAGIDVSYSF